MVRLDSPLEYAPHIVPICLPGSDDLLIGENATVTGWGRLSEGGTLPSVLQEVSLSANSISESSLMIYACHSLPMVSGMLFIPHNSQIDLTYNNNWIKYVSSEFD